MSKGAPPGKAVYRAVLALLLFSLLVGAGQTTVRASAKPAGGDFTSIDAYVHSEMLAASIPGLAYGIVKDGQVVHLRAFGVTGPGRQPMTVQTPMQIGSVGKTITALAIRQLINAGKIDLNAAVQRYIPWFRLADVQAAQTITIRDLLDHKSGLSTADGQDPTLYRERPTSEELVRGLTNVQPDRPVGSSYEYSNLNYLILGMVVQVVSGQSYEQYVQQHIFNPLDMRHSYLSEAEAEQHRQASGYRILFGYPVAMHVPYPRGLVAIGYQISSAQDMAHYLVAFANSGRYQKISVVTPDGKPSGEDQYYDVDWNPIQLSDTSFGFGHSGKNPNYAADIQLWPYGHLGVVVLTNANTTPIEALSTKNASTIASDVFRMYQGFQLAPPAQRISTAYIVIDTLFLVVLVVLAFHALRLRGWRDRVKHAKSRLLVVSLTVLTDGILPLCLLFAPMIVLTSLGDAPRFSPLKDWSLLFLIAPDIGSTLLVIAIVLLLIGAVKLFWMVTQQESCLRRQVISPSR